MHSHGSENPATDDARLALCRRLECCGRQRWSRRRRSVSSALRDSFLRDAKTHL